MSTEFKNSFFYALPNEILINILSRIDSESLLNFCQTYNCDYFLQDRHVVKTVDLGKKFYFTETLSFLSKNIAVEYITTLNLNCIHWITAAEMRKFISKCVNLEVLYVIQTRLGLSGDDIKAYQKTKVKKLGLTMNKFDTLQTEKLDFVETLYINFLHLTILQMFMMELVFPNLKKLWIDVEESPATPNILNSLNANNKIKFFCQVRGPVPFVDYKYYGLSTYYSNRGICNGYYIMCCEKFQGDVTEAEDNYEGPWRVLDNLHCPKPYNAKDALLLFLKKATLSTINFEELCFQHVKRICVERFRKACKEILELPCSTKIKKLSLSTCIFLDTGCTPAETVAKKRRKLRNESTSAEPSESIFQNFPALEHLEIQACVMYTHSCAQAYSAIATLKYLRNLTIEIPIWVDGSFLVEVLQNCTFLEILKVTSLAQNESLNFNMCRALPHAASLKDLRFENHHIPLDRLLNQLCLIKSRKLERLLLICKSIDKFSAVPLNNLVGTNLKLIFLYIVIKECTNAAVKMAQHTLNGYKKKRPSSVFLVKKVLCSPIPIVHYREMVQTDSTVSTLQPLEDFLYF